MKRSALPLVTLALLSLPCPLHCASPKRSEEIDKRVGVLIEKMLAAKSEQKAFSDLERLGCPAVPAIIGRMDDRRVLADPRISLRNKSPQAFEAVRQYGPTEVVDALAAILNQLTGQDFGSIYNGGTDDERTKTVHGWRKFLETTPAQDLCRSALILGE